MALMKFREQNQVKWVGVRPGHNGTQVAAYAAMINGVGVVYTVGAGKTLFLAECFLCSTGNITGQCSLAWYDDLWAFQRYFCMCDTIAGVQIQKDHCNFCPPLEIPAGHIIAVASGALGLTASGQIFGWEE